jgi:hypothetical protein
MKASVYSRANMQSSISAAGYETDSSDLNLIHHAKGNEISVLINTGLRDP